MIAHYSTHEQHATPEIYTDKSQKTDARLVAERGAEVLSKSMDYIVSSKSPQVTAWAVSYALGTACCEGMSITDRAATMGCSTQALSKQIREFADSIDIEPVYGYEKG